MKTLKEWRGSKLDLYKYLGFTYNQALIVEVDKELYWEMLECIYPSFQNSYLFQVGEPSSIVGGMNTFTTFAEISNRYFCIGDQLGLSTNKLASPIVQNCVNTIRSSIKLGVEVKQSPKDLKTIIKR